MPPSARKTGELVRRSDPEDGGKGGTGVPPSARKTGELARRSDPEDGGKGGTGVPPSVQNVLADGWLMFVGATYVLTLGRADATIARSAAQATTSKVVFCFIVNHLPCALFLKRWSETDEFLQSVLKVEQANLGRSGTSPSRSPRD